MAQFPQLPLWTDSYLADTTHLTTQEHGAYLLLLMAAWRSPGCNLPNDDEVLGHLARCPQHWWRMRATVMAFWTLNPEDGKYYQKRLTQERLNATIRSTQASQNAKAKYLKNNKLGDADAQRALSARSATTTTTIKEESSLSLKGSKRVHVRLDSPHWKACSERYRKEHRRWPPQDDRFGWEFPADWVETQAKQEALGK